MAHRAPSPEEIAGGNSALHTPKTQLNEPTTTTCGVLHKNRRSKGASACNFRGCHSRQKPVLSVFGVCAPFPRPGGPTERKFQLGSGLNQRDRATCGFVQCQTNRKPGKKNRRPGLCTGSRGLGGGRLPAGAFFERPT